MGRLIKINLEKINPREAPTLPRSRSYLRGLESYIYYKIRANVFFIVTEPLFRVVRSRTQRPVWSTPSVGSATHQVVRGRQLPGIGTLLSHFRSLSYGQICA